MRTSFSCGFEAQEEATTGWHIDDAFDPRVSAVLSHGECGWLWLSLPSFRFPLYEIWIQKVPYGLPVILKVTQPTPW